MLEGLKGDASEVARLAAAAQVSMPDGQADPLGVDGQAASDTTVRRLDTSDGPVSGVDGQPARALTAPSATTDRGVQARLQTAHAQARPDGAAWTARTLAQAAGCGRSTAAAFLRTQRQQTQEAEWSG